MPYVRKEKFREMIRSINVFLSIFDLTILYDENDDNYVCSWMSISDRNGNIVGTLRGPSYDRDLRRPAYYIDASTEAFPNLKARVISSEKVLLNEKNDKLGLHYFSSIDYDISTNNVLANNISGNFAISDPINNPDPREKYVEREIDFDLKVSQKPNEIFSISSKNTKFVIKTEYNEKYLYTGTRIIKMEYDGGSITLTIRKDGNSTLVYSSANGECRATASTLGDESHIEVLCIEKDKFSNLTDSQKDEYRSKKLERILNGTSCERLDDDSSITKNYIDIENDKRGNVIALFNAISNYLPQEDMYEIQNTAPVLTDYYGKDNILPIYVFHSIMSVAFGFLNDDELSSLIGLNTRRLPQTPIVDKENGLVILPQDKMLGIVKE